MTMSNASTKYTAAGLRRCGFKMNDKVIIDGCEVGLLGTYSHLQYVEKGDKWGLSYKWEDIQSFPEYDLRMERILQDLQSLLTAGWQMVKESELLNLHQIPSPLLFDSETLYFGKANLYIHDINYYIVTCDDEALKIISAFNNTTLSNAARASGSLEKKEIQFALTYIEPGKQKPDYVTDGVDQHRLLLSLLGQPVTPADTTEQPPLEDKQASENDTQTPLPFPSTQDATLPSMIGYEHSSLGSGDCLWTSPCYVLADRDLTVGEQLHVWAVDPINGRVLKTVSLTATEENKARAAWPAALVDAIQADDSQVNDSVLLQAGHIAADSKLSVAKQAPTSTDFANYDIVQKAEVDRLWAFDSHCSVFSNAPFNANQVSALTLNALTLTPGRQIALQLRHRTSQHLYECHVFEPDEGSASWEKPFCERINQHSTMIRAGGRPEDGRRIEPQDANNALWVPQLSDLNIQVEAVTWVDHGKFEAKRDLEPNERVWIAVHDDITGAPMKGSPFMFTAKEDNLARAKWPAAAAEALAASPVGHYLKLSDLTSEKGGTGEGHDEGKWWRLGIPLRIWMSEPFARPNWKSDANPETSEILEKILTKDSCPSTPVVVQLQDARFGHTCHRVEIALSKISTQTEAINHSELIAAHIVKTLIQHNILWCNLDPQAKTLKIQSESNMSIILVYRQEAKMLIMYSDRIYPDPSNATLVDEITLRALSRTTKHERKAIALELYGTDIGDKVEWADYWGRNTFPGEYDPHEDDPASPYFYAAHRLDLSVAANHEIHRMNAKGASIEIGKIDQWQQMLLDTLRSNSPMTSPNNKLFEPEDTTFKVGLNHNLQGEFDVANHTATSVTVSFYDDKKQSYQRDWPGKFCLILGANEIQNNFKFTACYCDPDVLSFRLYAPNIFDIPHTANILYGETSPFWLWRRSATYKTYAYIEKNFSLTDTLCADRSHTLGSTIFSSSHQHLHGVDNRTGLYSTSYDLATLQALGGKGPTIPLSIHYSALRANEGALGDGWAFSFSSFDNRRSILRLSSGQADIITKDEITKLLKSKSAQLDRHSYTLTATGSLEDPPVISTLTVTHAHGLIEVLQVPSESDGLEAGQRYKEALRRKTDAAIAEIETSLSQQGKDLNFGATVKRTISRLFSSPTVKAIYQEIRYHEDREVDVETEKKHLTSIKNELNLQLNDINREALLLVTRSITSLQGGLLLFDWQGQKGHVRLKTIKDGETVLLQAKHDSELKVKGKNESVFTFWPGTEETFDIQLDIENCLLRTLTRYNGPLASSIDQRLQFGYSPHPSLDQLLTSVAQEDGSLEVVNYNWTDDNAIPRVDRHTVIPNVHQPVITHEWAWEGDGHISAATCYRRPDAATELTDSPFTRWEWSINSDHGSQLDRQVEETPYAQRHITQYIYNPTAKHVSGGAVSAAVLRAQQTETRVTIEDLSALSAAKEQ